MRQRRSAGGARRPRWIRNCTRGLVKVAGRSVPLRSCTVAAAQRCLLRPWRHTAIAGRACAGRSRMDPFTKLPANPPLRNRNYLQPLVRLRVQRGGISCTVVQQSLNAAAARDIASLPPPACRTLQNDNYDGRSKLRNRTIGLICCPSVPEMPVRFLRQRSDMTIQVASLSGCKKTIPASSNRTRSGSACRRWSIHIDVSTRITRDRADGGESVRFRVRCRRAWPVAWRFRVR